MRTPRTPGIDVGQLTQQAAVVRLLLLWGGLHFAHVVMPGARLLLANERRCCAKVATARVPLGFRYQEAAAYVTSRSLCASLCHVSSGRAPRYQDAARTQ